MKMKVLGAVMMMAPFVLLGRDVNASTVNITVPTTIDVSVNEKLESVNSGYFIDARGSGVGAIVDNIHVKTLSEWSLVDEISSRINQNELVVRFNDQVLSVGDNQLDITAPKNKKTDFKFDVETGVRSERLAKVQVADMRVDYEYTKEDFNLSFTAGGNVESIAIHQNGDVVKLPTKLTTISADRELYNWEDSHGNIYLPGSDYVMPIGDVELKANYRLDAVLKNADLQIPYRATSVVFSDRKVPEGVTPTKLELNKYGPVRGFMDGSVYYVTSDGYGKVYAPENASSMFSDVSGDYKALTSVDFSNISTELTTNMADMFYYSSFRTLDLSGFDTSNVTNMKRMFANNDDLRTLDLTSFDTKNVTDMDLMFVSSLMASELSQILVGRGWVITNSLAKSQNIFGHNVHLKGPVPYVDGSDSWEFANYETGYLTLNEKVTLTFDDGATPIESYPYYELTLPVYAGLDSRKFLGWQLEGAQTWNEPAETIRLGDSDQRYKAVFRTPAMLTSDNLMIPSDATKVVFTSNAAPLVGVKILPSEATGPVKAWSIGSTYYISSDNNGVIYAPKNASSLFNNVNGRFDSIVEVDFENLSTKYTTLMDYTFYNMKLKMLDLTGFDMSNVTRMDGTFYGMFNLEQILVSETWDVSKVTHGAFTFNGLNASNFKAPRRYSSNATDKSYANYKTGYLTLNKLVTVAFDGTVDSIESWPYYEIVLPEYTGDESNLFKGWRLDGDSTIYSPGVKVRIDSVDQKFNAEIARGPVQLATNDLKAPVDTTRIEFTDAKVPSGVAITYLDSVTTSPLVKAWSVGTTYYVSSDGNGKVHAPVNASWMFSNDSSLLSPLNSVTSIGFSNFSTKFTTNMNSMFYKSRVVDLDLSSFELKKGVSTKYMFEYMSSLEQILVSELWDASNIGSSSTSMFSGLVGSRLKSPKLYNAGEVDKASAGYKDGYVTLNKPLTMSFGGEGVESIATWPYYEIVLPAYMGIEDDIFRGWKAKDDSKIHDTGAKVRVGQDDQHYDAEFRRGPVQLLGSGLRAPRETTNIVFTDEKAPVTGVDVTVLPTEPTSPPVKTWSVGTTYYVSSDGRGVIHAPVKTDSMFSNTSGQLADLVDIDFSNLSTKYTTTMNNMFMNSRLTMLDLSTFDMQSVTSTSGMFYGMAYLERIFVSELWDVSNVTNSGSMFYSLNKAKLKGPIPYNSLQVDKTHANYKTGYLTLNKLLKVSFDGSSIEERPYHEMVLPKYTGVDSNLFKGWQLKGDSVIYTPGVKIRLGEMDQEYEPVLARGLVQLANSDLNVPKDTTHIEFTDMKVPEDVAITYLDSEPTSPLVKAWSVGTTYYITSDGNGKVHAPVDSRDMFNNIDGAFANLMSVDFSNFSTKFTSNMYQMFYMSRIRDLDVSMFETNLVGNMIRMFSKMTNGYRTLDLSSFELRENVPMTSMFEGSSLDRIFVSEKWDSSKIGVSSSMFAGLSSSRLQSPGVYSSSSVDKVNANYKTGYLTLNERVTISFEGVDVSPVDTWSYYEIVMPAYKGDDEDIFRGWKAKDDLTIYETGKKVRVGQNDQYYNAEFRRGPVQLLNSNLIAPTNTTHIEFTDMKAPDSGVKILQTEPTSPPVKAWSVGTTYYVSSDGRGVVHAPVKATVMFSNVSGSYPNLTSVDFSNFSTKYTTSMQSMFFQSKIKSLDLSMFDTQYVTDMTYMFYGMSDLEQIFVSDLWDVSNVTTSPQMFYGLNSAKLKAPKVFSGSQVDKVNANYKTGYLTLKKPLNISFDGDVESIVGWPYYKMVLPSYTGVDSGKFKGWRREGDPVIYNPGSKALLDEMDETFEAVFAQGVVQLANSDLKVPIGTTHVEFTDIKAPDKGVIYLESEQTSPLIKAWSVGTTYYVSSDGNGRVHAPVDASLMFGYGLLDANVRNTLTSIDFSNFSTEFTTNMSKMFYMLPRVKDLDLSIFDTSSVTNMYLMFGNMSDLESVNVSSFNTEHVTDMNLMFYTMPKLKLLDLSSFKLYSGVTMNSMFNGNLSLERIYVSELWDESQIGSGYSMFSGLDATKLKAPKVFNASDVTHAYANYKTGYLTLDKMVKQTFEGTDIEPIEVLAYHEFVLPDYTGVDEDIFRGWKLKDESTIYDAGSKGRAGGVDQQYSAAFRRGPVQLLNVSFLKVPVGTTRVEFTDIKAPTTGVTVLPTEPTSPPVKAWSVGTTYYISSDGRGVIHAPASTEHMFNNINGGVATLASVDFSNFSTKYTTSMYAMFYRTKIKTLDLSMFDTSSVTRMDSMFYNMPDLERVFVSESWDTSKVTNSTFMFYGLTASKLKGPKAYNSSQTDKLNANYKDGYLTLKKPLNISFDDDVNRIETWPYHEIIMPAYKGVDEDLFGGWKATDGSTIYEIGTRVRVGEVDQHYEGLFRNGPARLLTSDLKIPANTTHVEFTDMKAPDVGVTILPTELMSPLVKAWSVGTTYYISSEGHGKVYAPVKANLMFGNSNSKLAKLTSVDFSNFSTEYTTSMTNMFHSSNIINLDLSMFDTRNVTTMYGMFNSMSKLRSLDISSFDTRNVTDMTYMFAYQTLIEELDLSSFELSPGVVMTLMFVNASNLERIFVSDKWVASNIVSGDSMFSSLPKLKGPKTYVPSQSGHVYANYQTGYLTLKKPVNLTFGDGAATIETWPYHEITLPSYIGPNPDKFKGWMVDGVLLQSGQRYKMSEINKTVLPEMTPDVIVEDAVEIEMTVPDVSADASEEIVADTSDLVDVVETEESVVQDDSVDVESSESFEEVSQDPNVDGTSESFDVPIIDPIVPEVTEQQFSTQPDPE